MGAQSLQLRKRRRKLSRQADAKAAPSAARRRVEELVAVSLDQARSEHDRARAISALGDMRARGAVRTLLRIFSEKDPILKWTAAQSLGLIGSKAATRWLVDIVRNAADLEGRRAAVHALGYLRDPRAADMLIGVLENARENPGIRGDAAESLTFIPSERKVPALIRALRDRSAEVRLFAANALAHCRDSRDRPVPEVLPAVPILEQLLCDHEPVKGFGTVAEEARYALDQIQASNAGG